MLQERKQPFRAGEWIVKPEINALSRNGKEQRVEPKVMQVLLTLASRQNQVFAKSELMAAVWPDTFVSEDVLTRCISILRRITADDPQAPRFIQTVPRVGYRLVAAVQEIESTLDAEARPADKSSAGSAGYDERPTLPAPSPRSEQFAPPLSQISSYVQPELASKTRERTSQFWALAALGSVLCACLAWWLLIHRAPASRAVPRADLSAIRTVIFTPDPGEQSNPAFSPDGASIAFVRTSEHGGLQQICVKRIGDTTYRTVAPSDAQQFSPAWSPDGHRLAFLATQGVHRGVYLVVADGSQPAIKVYAPEEPSQWEEGALSWSPDGRALIFPDHQNSLPYSSIVRLDLASGHTETLTVPPRGWEGDLNPVYSPDGSKIAFTRASETAVRDLCWLDLRDRTVHQLTHETANIAGLSWTRDGNGLIFASNTGGQYALWRATLGRGVVDRMPVGTENATQPAVGPRPGQLAYTQGGATWSIDHVGVASAPVASTQEDSAPSISPDGRWFAFQSRRSGTQQIWTAALDGTHLHQLTTGLGRMAGSPSWSHAGDRILFDARPSGHSHIFEVSAHGGPVRQLTFGEVNDIVPRWSADDGSVYFRSNRSGRWQLWKAAVDGSALRQVTEGDGIAGQETKDGRAVYFTRGDEAGLWKLDLQSGREAKVSPDPPAGYWGYFQPTDKGVLVLSDSHRPNKIGTLAAASPSIFAARSVEHQAPLFQGLTATADERVVLISGVREAEQHVSLVTGLDVLR